MSYPSKKLYIINPASVHPHYSSYEVYKALGLRPVIFTLDQSTTTLAAMAPEDFFVEICDESVCPADLDTQADYICITGRISQWERMKTLAQAYRARGKTIIMGGPQVTLDPDAARPFCDILVLGEIEEIYPELFSDLLANAWKPEYKGGQPDLSLGVAPRLDLYPNGHTLVGSIQTSRGCPFQCEFCAAAKYNGRTPRHKPIALLLKELDALYDTGYRTVFITDDNFTARSGKANEILEAFTWWNDARTSGRVYFIAQVSVDAAKDEELLNNMARAGITDVFVGIETFNPESLAETRKVQNLNVDFKSTIHRFLAAGIGVQGGLIAGFDADEPKIFPLMSQFASSLPIPYYNIDSLVALPGTHLHSRMAKSGRLINNCETSGLPWLTNIEPLKMSQAKLSEGMQWLCSNLYHPRQFETRIRKFINAYKPLSFPETKTPMDPIRTRRYNRFRANADKLIHHIAGLGQEEAAMLERLDQLGRENPQSAPRIRSFVHDYAQTRHLYAFGDFYDPALAKTPFH